MTSEHTPITDLSREELLNFAEELTQKVGYLEENWDDAATAMLRIRAEDAGWKVWSGVVDSDDKGFSFEVTKDVAEAVGKQSAGNPLMKQGFNLRYNNVFAKGVFLENASSQKQNKLKRNSVRRVLWGDAAFETNERCLFETGNLIVAVNRRTGDAIRIPLDQVTDWGRNPEDPTEIWYYQRTYQQYEPGESTPKSVTEWYTVLEHYEDVDQLPANLGQYRVNPDWVVVDLKVNVPTDGLWGIADGFAAMPYAWAYSQYIRNASSLLEALNQIAWKIVSRSKSGAQNAGVRMAAPRKNGMSAVMSEGTDLVAMPRSGQVDMSDGLALAAMAASSLAVPLTALLFDSSSAGSYGAVASLDGPAVASARARQRKWQDFYDRVFRALGMRDVTVNFPKLSEDPIHRQVASLAVGRTTGAIWGDEYRAAFLEAMDVAPLHTEGPPVDDYAMAQNALGFLTALQKAEAEGSSGDTLSRPGHRGVASSLADQDLTVQRDYVTPGTGSVE